MAFSDASWDTTEFDSILKNFYLGPVQDTLNNKTVLLRRFARNEEDVSGRQVITPLRVGRNEGIGAIGKGGILPQPKQQSYRNLAFTVQLFYGRAMFPGPDMAEARNDRGAFLRLMNGEIDNLVIDMKHEFNRIIHGNGSGALAVVVTDSVTDQVVNNPGGFANDSNGTLYIRPGMILMPVSAAGAVTSRVPRTVTSVDPATNTVTFDADPVSTAGDYLVRASEAGTAGYAVVNTGYDNEPMGIAGIIDDGNPPTRNLEGIDASANDWWQAVVMDNSGVNRDLSLDLLQQSEDELDIYADAAASIIHSDHVQRRKYLDLLEAQKRFVDRLTLDGGFRALEYNEVPWSVDKDCQAGRIYMIDEEPIQIFQMSDFFYLQKDGSILARDEDRDMYQLAMAYYGEAATNNRKRGLVIVDLNS